MSTAPRAHSSGWGTGVANLTTYYDEAHVTLCDVMLVLKKASNAKDRLVSDAIP